MDKKLEARDLTGNSRCITKKRHASLNLDAGRKTVPLKVSAFLTEYVKNAVLDGKWDEQDVRDFFDTSGIAPEAVRKAYEEEAVRCAVRYLTSETRKASPAPARTVDCFGIEVRVTPSLVFKGMREVKRDVVKSGKKEVEVTLEPYIEIVFVENRKPDVSAKGRKPDAGTMTNLRMYCGLLYGKDIAHECLEAGTVINVGCSFYFLKKSTDKADSFNPMFFETEKGERPNVASLWATVEAGNRAPDSIDLAYTSVFNGWMHGEDMKGSDACRFCELASMCGVRAHESELPDTVSASKLVTADMLTKEQRDAVAFRKGFARIDAGAGSGKTSVVALRASQLLREGGSVLLITFTDGGAKEFRGRITQYMREDEGAAAGRLTAVTFNSFGDGLIRENYGLLGFERPPRLIDEIERMSLVAEIVGGSAIEGLDYRHFDMDLPTAKGALPITAEVFDIFKRERITDLTEDSCAAVTAELGRDAQFMPGDGTLKALFKLYRDKYLPMLKERCLIEYEDQLLFMFDLLELKPELFDELGYEHIIVDEFQDTNERQFEILMELIDTPSFKSLMVVGDDSQSIYGFRGTTPEFIIRFADRIDERVGKPVEEFFLLENHRSTPEIVAFANKTNARNKNRVDKDLVATRPPGKPVLVLGSDTVPEVDARLVAVVKDRHASGVPYEDMAYIAFTRAELLRAKKALAEAGIEGTLMCPEPMLEDPRILAALSFAQLVTDPSATKYAFDYVVAVTPEGQIDACSDERILAGVREAQDLAEEIGRAGPHQAEVLFDGALANIRGDESAEAYDAFRDALAERSGLAAKLAYCEGLLSYGGKAAYKKTRRYAGVTLITAHSSKGMEYPVVINNVTKYDSPDLSDGEREERRRLMFVSATRARDELVIVGKSIMGGKADDPIYNRLLAEAEIDAG